MEQEKLSFIKNPLQTASKGKIQVGFIHFISYDPVQVCVKVKDQGPWKKTLCLCVFVTEWDVHAAAGGHVCSLLLFGYHCYL